jgi:hypothetical protein
MTEMLKEAYHYQNGLTRMYAVDANMAVAQHPEEWSFTPWSADDAAAARKAVEERHAKEVEAAKAAGAAPPAPLPPEPLPPTPEEQAAIDVHNQAVSEAKERLAKFYEEEKKRKEIEDQVAADKAMVASPPPQPDPNARRPFGRKGEPTEAEKAMMAKKAEKDAEAERIAKEKAETDKIAGAKVAL